MKIISYEEKTKDQIVITRKERDFTQIENSTIRDTELSLRAKGLLLLLLSFGDNGNTIIPIHSRELAKHCKESHTSITTVLKELQEQHFCYRHQFRSVEGHFSIVRYFVYETRELYEAAQHRAKVKYSRKFGINTAYE